MDKLAELTEINAKIEGLQIALFIAQEEMKHSDNGVSATIFLKIKNEITKLENIYERINHNS